MHKSHSLTISNGSFFQHLSSDESFSLSTGWLSWMSSSKPLLLFRGSSMWDKWRDSRMMIRIESLRKKKAKWLKTFSPFLGVTFPTSRLAQIFVCNNKNELGSIFLVSQSVSQTFWHCHNEEICVVYPLQIYITSYYTLRQIAWKHDNSTSKTFLPTKWTDESGDTKVAIFDAAVWAPKRLSSKGQI